METPPDPLQVETPQQDTPKTSLSARIFNVFATPSEVFEEVRTSPPCNANWVTPAVIAVVVGWLATALIFSQESIRHQLTEMTEQAIEKQIAKTKPSEQQAEQMRAASVKIAGISQKIGAYAMAPIMAFASPFIWGSFLWLAGNKALKGHFTYMQAVEVWGWETWWECWIASSRPCSSYPWATCLRPPACSCWSRNTIPKIQCITCSRWLT